MNLTKKRKKKGFTLIELMAVIAIIAILAAVLVPTVTGYINRAKKTAIITQARNVVNAVETYNATADKPIVPFVTDGASENSEIVNPTLKQIVESVGSDLLTTESIDKLYEGNDASGTNYYIIYEINSDSDAIKDINLKNNNKLDSFRSGDKAISLNGSKQP